MNLRIRKFGEVGSLWLAVIMLSLLVSCGEETDPSSLTYFQTAYLQIRGGPTFDFGAIAVGESRSITFEIQNTGRVPATRISSVPSVSAFRYTGGSYPGVNGTCSRALAVAEPCEIEIEFAPLFPTDYQMPLRISYFDLAGEHTSDDAFPQLLLQGRGT